MASLTHLAMACCVEAVAEHDLGRTAATFGVCLHVLRKDLPALAEVEEQILEKDWCPDYREQQRLEASNHSQVENEVARTRCRHLLDGGHGAISLTEILGER